MSPPAATYMRPGAGQYIYIIQVRFHRYPGGVFVGHRPPGTPVAACNITKFYISTDGTRTHTHAPQQRGRWWKGNESEMTMKMAWQLLNWDARRGAQKKKGKKEKTPTPTHLAQSGQTLKGQGKRTSGRTTDQRPTRGGGRGEAPDTTYKARAKPTSAREGPKPDLTREHTWDRGPMGT